MEHINPSVTFSDWNDSVQATQCASNAVRSVTARHVVKYVSDVDVFDGGFPRVEEDVSNTTVNFPGPLPHRRRCLVPVILPPSTKRIRDSVEEATGRDGGGGGGVGGLSSPPSSSTQKYNKSQISSPTQTQPQPQAHTSHLSQMKETIGCGNAAGRKSRLTVMSLEVLCEVRQHFLPNPKYDGVVGVFWVVDDSFSDAESEATTRYHGVIARGTAQMPMMGRTSFSGCGLPAATDLQIASNEVSLFELLVVLVRKIDPDFFVGYDVNRESLGYIIKRGKILNMDMLQLLSKMPSESPSFLNRIEEEDSVEGGGTEQNVYITGRGTLNLWKCMRSELKLMSYTYSNVAAHLLSMQVPAFSHAQLHSWFSSRETLHRSVRHVHMLAELNLILINKIDLMRKTAESARLGLHSIAVVA
jgi:DNA polymerase zeta